MTGTQKSEKHDNLKNVHDRITQRIVERLEEGVVPWHTPHFATVGFPRNFQSGKHYRGVNVMLLGMAGYVSPWFLTYQQAQERGGQVRKGEKGYLVVKFGTYARELDEGQQEMKKIPATLRRFQRKPDRRRRIPRTAACAHDGDG